MPAGGSLPTEHPAVGRPPVGEEEEESEREEEEEEGGMQKWDRQQIVTEPLYFQL